MSWFRSYESLYPKGGKKRGWRSPLSRARKAIEEAVSEEEE